MLILPTVNAFMREYRIGAIELLKELSTKMTEHKENIIISKENLQQQGEEEERQSINIRILTPTNEAIDKIIT